MTCSPLMKPTIRPWRLRDYIAELHLSGVWCQLKSHQVENEFNRVSQWLTNRQHNRRLKPLCQPTTTLVSLAKNKDNPYVKPKVSKCYRCGKPGHRSNECLKRKQVNVANYRDDEGVMIEDEIDSDFAEENGDLVVYIVQRLLCNQKSPDTT